MRDNLEIRFVKLRKPIHVDLGNEFAATVFQIEPCLVEAARNASRPQSAWCQVRLSTPIGASRKSIVDLMEHHHCDEHGSDPYSAECFLRRTLDGVLKELERRVRPVCRQNISTPSSWPRGVST